jgi:hypothetical protein
MLFFGMYMVGRDEKSAAPTIVLSSNSRTARRKAKKYIKKSALLEEFEGVLLAESSRPLVSIQEPRPIAGKDEECCMIAAENQQRKNVYMISPHSMDWACGIPISIQYEQEKPPTQIREATIGGILQQGNTY